MKYLIGLLLAALILTSGFWLGWQKRQIVPAIKEQKSVDIFYVKADGLYRTSSDKEGEELVVKDAIVDLKRFGRKLVYLGTTGLQLYDLDSGSTTVVEPAAETVIFASISPSPDGQKIAYVKNITVGDFGFKNELWLWDVNTGQKQKILQEPALGEDPEGVYYVMRLNGWLDNNRLLVGRAYEGVSFCPFTVGVDTTLPQQCVGYGSEGIGLLDRILTGDDGIVYGVKRLFFPEAGVAGRDQTGLYSQLSSDQKQFFTADEASSLVKKGDILYMTKLLDGSTYEAVEADIFEFNLVEEVSRRLTHDATSVATKEALGLSDSGRFLSWESRDISTNTFSVWVYDLLLNQSYQVSAEARHIIVIDR